MRAAIVAWWRFWRSSAVAVGTVVKSLEKRVRSYSGAARVVALLLGTGVPTIGLAAIVALVKRYNVSPAVVGLCLMVLLLLALNHGAFLTWRRDQEEAAAKIANLSGRQLTPEQYRLSELYQDWLILKTRIPLSKGETEPPGFALELTEWKEAVADALGALEGASRYQALFVADIAPNYEAIENGWGTTYELVKRGELLKEIVNRVLPRPPKVPGGK